jgi:hypothetical protein
MLYMMPSRPAARKKWGQVAISWRCRVREREGIDQKGMRDVGCSGTGE